jgi:hypothetical protein
VGNSVTPPPIMTPMPPPRPPRSIAGPVVLILLGVLFLLGTMGIMNIHHIGWLFARYWPALLILWGVLKLVEYEQAKRYGQQTRGIGVGGFFLVLFLVGAGLIATKASEINWRDLGGQIQLGDDQSLDDIFSGGSAYNFSGTLSNDWPVAAKSLRINDDRGTVTVNIADDNKLRVEWRKKVRAENQNDANNYNSKTDPTIEKSENVITLNGNTHAAGDKSVSLDLDVYLPKNSDLSITSRRGAITVNGRNGNVEINNQHGDVTVNDLTGNAVLNLEESSARAQHVKGDISIQGHANEVAIEDVEGAVHLNGEFQESTRLVRVSRTVSFHSSRTDMEFSRLDGSLDLDSSDLRADSLLGPMRLATRSKDISLEGLSGDLRLEDSNGTINLAVRKPGNIQIDNKRGDVQISIPPNTPVKIEARTHQGEISSEFDEIKVENREHESSANGSIGANGPKMAVNCDRGEIEFRKGTVAESVAPTMRPMVPMSPVTPKPGKALPAPKAPPVESEN